MLNLAWPKGSKETLFVKNGLTGQRLITLMHVQIRPVGGARALYLELPTQYHHLDPSNGSAVKLLQYWGIITRSGSAI